jgi:hypothetical protein
MQKFWLFDPTLIPHPTMGGRRKLTLGPLMDLAQLHQAIADGSLDTDGLWVATKRCETDLENYQWSYDAVLKMISCLHAEDYHASEWCDVGQGRFVVCDAYKICYDDSRHQRNPRALEVYLKFSIDDVGTLTLVLVQAHLSR